MRYALPERGWGLPVVGVWTRSSGSWALLRHGTTRGLYALRRQVTW